MIKARDTASGEEFDIDANGVNMYVCGPTVYSHTHLGHVKTYVSFDIIRRVMEDHFNVPTQYMINITNIDDKIIKGAYERIYGEGIDLRELKSSDRLSEETFRVFADEWEKAFFVTMDRLNVKRPDIVSRVTEYIPEILQFVEVLEKKGYAFENDGSVYFYGTKYHQQSDDKEDMEGYDKDPSNPHNFVLLKKKKDYEPGWQSKWGQVRPGWHIECSVMASSVFGSELDIHGGGIDLKFPHHANEEIQSNVYHNYPSNPPNQSGALKQTKWVKNFMHTGHLNIDGLKMSKSLKNFITAQDALREYSPDQIRMLFLMHKWSDPMNYSEESMATSNDVLDGFLNFKTQMMNVLMLKSTKMDAKFTLPDVNFMDLIKTSQSSVDDALRSNFNTPKSVKILQELCSQTYIYVKSSENVSGRLVENTVNYIGKMLKMFGIMSYDGDTKDTTKEDKLIKSISQYRTDIRNVAKSVSKDIKKIDKDLAKRVGGRLFGLTDSIREDMKSTFDVELID